MNAQAYKATTRSRSRSTLESFIRVRPTTSSFKTSKARLLRATAVERGSHCRA